jgi:hypothetical protein
MGEDDLGGLDQSTWRSNWRMTMLDPTSLPIGDPPRVTRVDPCIITTGSNGGKLKSENSNSNNSIRKIIKNAAVYFTNI